MDSLFSFYHVIGPASPFQFKRAAATKRGQIFVLSILLIYKYSDSWII
nr:MAG TPA: hypothetical protein [Caudoviricetes sp.]